MIHPGKCRRAPHASVPLLRHISRSHRSDKWNARAVARPGVAHTSDVDVCRSSHGQLTEKIPAHVDTVTICYNLLHTIKKHRRIQKNTDQSERPPEGLSSLSPSLVRKLLQSSQCVRPHSELQSWSRSSRRSESRGGCASSPSSKLLGPCKLAHPISPLHKRVQYERRQLCESAFSGQISSPGSLDVKGE